MKNNQDQICRKGGRRLSGGIGKESTPDRPLISVITVVYNGESCLEKSIISVLEQSYTNFEYLIVDGNSTDRTVEIIRKFDDQIDYWTSEPDKGIYDAMNKALDTSRGDWVYFLGADDRLYSPDSLAKMVPHLDHSFALVFGSICYPNGRIVTSSLGPRTLIRNCLHHQGGFYNAALFRDWRYDDSLQIAADYELNLVIYLTEQKYKKTKEIVASCDDKGISLACLKAAVSEINAIRKRHVGGLANLLLSGVFRLEMIAYNTINSLKTKTAA